MIQDIMVLLYDVIVMCRNNTIVSAKIMIYNQIHWNAAVKMTMNLSSLEALKPLETNGCVINTVTTVVLELKHQTISSHIADKIFIVSDQFYTKILYFLW